MSSRAEQIVRALNTQREAFNAFLVACANNAAEAEGVVQNGPLFRQLSNKARHQG